MECPHCSTWTSGILELNNIWCDSCGTSIRVKMDFVQSFQNPHDHVRQQIYSRVKRFTKWVQQLADPLVMSHMYSVIYIYSSFEFAWMMHKEDSTRIYFFAKPVCLQVCCQMLHINADLPHLKDGNREKVQKEELKKLQTTEMWSYRFNSYTTMKVAPVYI